MKDKDTHLIWEAYGSSDRVSTGIGQETHNPTEQEVGTLQPGYTSRGSAVTRTNLQEIINTLHDYNPYGPGTTKFTKEFKEILESELSRVASTANRWRDPEDHKEVDERTVADELDNYIKRLSQSGTHEPYKAIRRYLEDKYGKDIESARRADEEGYDDPRPNIHIDHY